MSSESGVQGSKENSKNSLQHHCNIEKSKIVALKIVANSYYYFLITSHIINLN